MMTLVNHTTTAAIAAVRRGRQALLVRARGQRGEGVISAAIVVLIMAVIGAGMWVTFNTVWNDARSDIETNARTIGDPAAGG